MLDSLQRYIDKSIVYPPLIEKQAKGELELILVIPSYNEAGLASCLDQCLSVIPLDGSVEIIVVLNHSQNANAEVKELHREQSLKLGHHLDKDVLHIIGPLELRPKDAGVGMARKIGMDEAVRRFQSISKRRGIICCYDADCRMSPYFISAVKNYFQSEKSKQAISLGFHHRWEELRDPLQRRGILEYEFHLFLYLAHQKVNDYPFAFHTIGSSMAVRADAYCEQGGMNRRQAGEDFYFLHKFSAVFELDEINEDLVFPSPRVSDRVPFGTGRAVGEFLMEGNRTTLSYNPASIRLFSEAFHFIHKIEDMGVKHYAKSCGVLMSLFLDQYGFDEYYDQAVKNSSNSKVLHTKLRRFFNPFCLMKFLHFAEEHDYPKIRLMESYEQLDKSKLRSVYWVKRLEFLANSCLS
ncbi:MAG TPA: glycosyltransferase [Saprospiraceae bacterium]|nr:glycosyltransferase [Saprospiraceae bacterium]